MCFIFFLNNLALTSQSDVKPPCLLHSRTLSVSLQIACGSPGRLPCLQKASTFKITSLSSTCDRHALHQYSCKVSPGLLLNLCSFLWVQKAQRDLELSFYHHLACGPLSCIGVHRCVSAPVAASKRLHLSPLVVTCEDEGLGTASLPVWEVLPVALVCVLPVILCSQKVNGLWAHVTDGRIPAGTGLRDRGLQFKTVDR